MLTNNDLAVVGSPLQLLCAVDASVNWRADSLDVLFVDNGLVINTEYTKRLANFLLTPLSDTFTKQCALRRLSGYCLPFRVKNKIKADYNKKSYRNIYFGHVMPHIALIAANIKSINCIRVDDGAGTINLDQRLREEDSKIRNKIALPWIHKAFLKYNLPSHKPFHLYTMFSREAFTHPSISDVTTNTLSNVGTPTGPHQLNGEAWIIGAPLSEAGIVKSPKVEVQFLKHCFQSLYKQGYNPIYVPHRREKKTKLDLLSKSTFFSLKKLNSIVEQNLLSNSSKKPSLVTSVSSTCLKTTQLINCGTKSFLLPLDEAYLEHNKASHKKHIRERLNKDYDIPYLPDLFSL